MRPEDLPSPRLAFGAALILAVTACSGQDPDASPAGQPGAATGPRPSAAYNELDPEAYQRAHCQQIAPGLFSPMCYGLNSWDGLHARVRRNQANAELDLAKLAAHRGLDEEARERALRAVDINLAMQGPPADLIRHVAHPHRAPNRDPRPLEQRLKAAVEDGWCGYSLVLLTELDPSWVLRLGHDGAAIGSDAEPCASLLLLRAAQAHAQAGQDDQARAAARQAAQRMREQIVLTMEATPPGEPMPAPPQTWEWAPLIHPTRRLGFHWGWPHMEDQLALLAEQAAVAAQLTGNTPLILSVEQTADALAELVELRADIPELGLRWTTAEALGRVPT
jgi:hypothetical protein